MLHIMQGWRQHTTMHGCQPIAKGHLSDSGEIKSLNQNWEQGKQSLSFHGRFGEKKILCLI